MSCLCVVLSGAVTEVVVIIVVSVQTLFDFFFIYCCPTMSGGRKEECMCVAKGRRDLIRTAEAELTCIKSRGNSSYMYK